MRLRGGEDFIAESIESRDLKTVEIIANAKENLIKTVLAYRSPEKGYISRRAPFKDSEMGGDYDHLARVREWSFGEENEDG